MVSSTDETGSIIRWIVGIIKYGPQLVTVLLAVIAAIPKSRKWLIKNAKKIWYLYFPHAINIVLAIESKEGLNSGIYYQELKKELLRAIELNGLTDVLHFKDFSDSVVFSSQKAVAVYAEKNNIDLIISGRFTEDGLNVAGSKVNELDLTFTFTHPTDKKRMLGNLMLFDIQTKMAEKNFWKIRDNESLEDLKLVTKNLFYISLYILAITLKVQGRITKSKDVFEALSENLIKAGDNFYRNIVPHLINCYELLCLDAYFLSRYAECKEYGLKILKMDDRHKFALASLAVCENKLGNLTASSDAVKRLEYFYPNSPMTMVDVAFIRIIEGKYGEAFELYKKLTKIPVENLDYAPVEVVGFLNCNFDTSREPAMRYATAVISYYHLNDKVLAKQDLDDFLRLVEGKRGYQNMIRTAKTLKDKIEIRKL